MAAAHGYSESGTGSGADRILHQRGILRMVFWFVLFSLVMFGESKKKNQDPGRLTFTASSGPTLALGFVYCVCVALYRHII